jgi:hypothetical protein
LSGAQQPPLAPPPNSHTPSTQRHPWFDTWHTFEDIFLSICTSFFTFSVIRKKCENKQTQKDFCSRLAMIWIILYWYEACQILIQLSVAAKFTTCI